MRVLNIASGKSRTLLTPDQVFSTSDSGQYFQWSPDGQWLLFDYAVPGIASGEVGLVKADGSGKVVNLTKSGFEDRRGDWVQGGEAMLWQTNRDGLASSAHSGGSQFDVYAMFFTRDAWDRFRLNEDDYALLKDQEEQNKPKPDTAERPTPPSRAAVEPVALDLEEMALRKARLTTNSSSLGGALLSKDGETLYYLARFEEGYDLWSTEPRSGDTKLVATLNANGADMVWDKDQKTIFLQAGGSLSKIDPSSGKRDNISIRGEMVQDADAQRAYLFEHVWMQTKETFYTAGYHGVDWEGIKPVYAKYLPHIGDGYEFAEMLSEMLGELNISHSGARFNSSTPTDDATASLGIFYDQSYDGTGIRVVEVIKNGPLDQAGMNVAARHDHRIHRRRARPRRRRPGPVPESKGRQEDAPGGGRGRRDPGDRRRTHHAGSGESPPLRPLGPAKPGGSGFPERWCPGLRPRTGDERRRLPGRLRRDPGAFRHPRGNRGGHPLQRRRRPGG